jgi:hypothetical protein
VASAAVPVSSLVVVDQQPNKFGKHCVSKNPNATPALLAQPVVTAGTQSGRCVNRPSNLNRPLNNNLLFAFRCLSDSIDFTPLPG